jgi:hypothetical protein
MVEAPVQVVPQGLQLQMPRQETTFMKPKLVPPNIPIRFKGSTTIPVFDCVAFDDFYYPVTEHGKRPVHGCYLVFQCPVCRRVHQHGGVFGKIIEGDEHRTAHCRCWPKGYYLWQIDPSKVELIKPFSKPNSDYERGLA